MKQAEIAQLLPAVFQRTLAPGSLLSCILATMEAQHAPSETVLAQLACYFDPYLAPDEFVPFLAAWVDLDPLFTNVPASIDAQAANELFPMGLGRLRELIAAVAYRSQWRGTAKGMIHFLEVATGVTGFKVDERVFDADGRQRPFHIRVRTPLIEVRTAQEKAACAALIERIITLEKPAYVTFELKFNIQILESQ